jgi:hypothetical protein
LIPDAPRPSTNPTPTPPTTYHVVDGVIGTFHAETQSAHTSHTNPKYNNSNAQNTLTPSTGNTVEVNYVQSAPTRNNQNKKKGKGKNKDDKNNSPQFDKAKIQTVDEKNKHKPCYPYLICGDNHYMKDCPRCVEVTKFLQRTGKPPTPVVLSQPLPSQ